MEELKDIPLGATVDVLGKEWVVAHKSPARVTLARREPRVIALPDKTVETTRERHHDVAPATPCTVLALPAVPVEEPPRRAGTRRGSASPTDTARVPATPSTVTRRASRAGVRVTRRKK